MRAGAGVEPRSPERGNWRALGRAPPMQPGKRKLRLTDRAVSTAKPGASEHTVSDSSLNHIGLRVYPSGERSFIVQIRVQGRLRKITLGRYPATGLAEARKQGTELLARIWAGQPPAPVRKPIALSLTSLTTSSAHCRAPRQSRCRPCGIVSPAIHLSIDPAFTSAPSPAVGLRPRPCRACPSAGRARAPPRGSDPK